MEGIVVGIAQMNFHQDLIGITSENGASNFTKDSSTIMSVCESNFPNSEESTICNQDVNNSTLNNVSEAETFGDSGWEEIEDDLDSSRQNRKGFTLAERRQMPTRASKESCLLGIKRRTIMKPSKRVKNHEDFQNLNKKLTNFKPSSLETIFEETLTIHNNEQESSRLMGVRKIRRSLTFSDGFRYNKTIVNKRRAKIKKTFGKRFALKKISLDEFITKLDNGIEQNEEDPNDECQIQGDKNENVNKFSFSDIFASNNYVNLDDEAMTTKNLPSTELSNQVTNNMSL